MTTKPPSRTAEQFVLRLPDGMRARIAEVAKANGRSMNAEIVARLEKSFSATPQLDTVEEVSAASVLRDALTVAMRSPEFAKTFQRFGKVVMKDYENGEPKPAKDPK